LSQGLAFPFPSHFAPRLTKKHQIAQRARGQSLRFASSQAAPHVDEIEFEMLGDPTTASYPSMPFPTETREQLEQGIATKAQELTKQWESKFSSKSDLNAVLAKDVLEFKPVPFSSCPSALPSSLSILKSIAPNFCRTMRKLSRRS